MTDTMREKKTCFCLAPLIEVQVLPASVGLGHYYDCPRCGRYEIFDGDDARFMPDIERAATRSGELTAPALSHLIRSASNSGRVARVTEQMLRDVLKSPSLPNVAEQAENLVLWLGAALEQAGTSIRVDALNHRSIAAKSG